MFKCQSLGNNFILFDDLTVGARFIAPDIKKTCQRHHVDGVLIVKKNPNNQIEGQIFNADGSNGDKCINGLRCIAYYLVTQKNYPSELEIFMGDRVMQCSVTDKIIINVGKADYIREYKLTDKNIIGHIVNVGNPHFVILEKRRGDRRVALTWLTKNGAAIEQHKDFPKRTNVEFVWPENNNSYNILVYERGWHNFSLWQWRCSCFASALSVAQNL